MAYTRKVIFTKTCQYGCGPVKEDDVYTIKEFFECCSCDAFIDDDGHGYPVKNKLADDSIMIQPSKLGEIPLDATHIMWINK